MVSGISESKCSPPSYNRQIWTAESQPTAYYNRTSANSVLSRSIEPSAMALNVLIHLLLPSISRARAFIKPVFSASYVPGVLITCKALV